MEYEWGPWTVHDGKGAKHLKGKYVKVKYLNGKFQEGVIIDGMGRSWFWSDLAKHGWSKRKDGAIFNPVIQYCIRKDKGQEKDQRTQKGMDVLKDILKQPTKELETV